jgi:GNAT superfamily N-acetyltransferase
VFEEQLLDPKRHDRTGFACGEPALDAFLQRHAHQNMRKSCFRMGRLARDLRWRGEGLGVLLIGLAVERALQARQSVGGYALIMNAKGEEANSFYLRYGFRPYLETPNSLCLPLGGYGGPS